MANRIALVLAVLLPLVLMLTLGMLLRPAQSAHAAEGPLTFIVTSDADIPDLTPGDGVCDIGINNLCTLRAAVQESNATIGGSNTIVLQANTTYTLVRSGSDFNALNGDLDINSALTITGAGPTSTIINGNGSVTGDRVFEINSNVVLSGVAIINGRVAGDGGAIRAVNGFNVWLINTVVRNNAVTSANGHGGGIYSEAYITMTHSAVLSNTTPGDGGGFYNSFGATSIADSTFAWNTAGGHGGGLYQLLGIVTLMRDTLRNNSASYGGGITHNAGEFNLTNSTLALNTALYDGGGIYIARGSNASVSNATIAFNTANATGSLGGIGGGIATSTTATLDVMHSIVAGNGHRIGVFFYYIDECAGNVTAVASNIFETVMASHCTVTGQYTLTDPLLLSLGNYGGATETLALSPASPAIDAAGIICYDAAGQLLLTDQRGKPRPALGGKGHCDLGAYEFNFDVFLPVIRR